VVLVALAGVLVLAAVAALLAWQQYQDARDSALRAVRARTVLAATVFDTYFAGQIAQLNAVADAPAVVAADQPAMTGYFKRVVKSNPQAFTGGLGWIDRQGVSRVSSITTPPGQEPVSVADRTYFRQAMTGKPFISEGITARRSNQHIVVIAVPTHDAGGQVSGVLAGALLVNPTQNSQRTIDLGFQGLVVLDRLGQSVLAGFSKPRNAALVAQLQRSAGPDGRVLGDTRGLSGTNGHVVAYANSAVPGWVVAIDQPRSEVLSAARRSLALSVAAIGGVAALVLALFIRSVLRARRATEQQDRLVREQTAFAGQVAGASAVRHVCDAAAGSLAAAFPGTLAVVALATEDGLGARIAAASGGVLDRVLHGPAVNAVAEQALEAPSPLAYETAEELCASAPHVATAFGGARQSLYAQPLAPPGGERIGALVLLFASEIELDDDERRFVAGQAEQAALGIVRTQVREREHEVATQLQRSLLPERLPAVDGLDLAARYNAGSTGLVIGGDWYDAVVRPDGLVHVTVGDVAGRGIEAATLMGQIRNAFRAYALEHSSPAEVLVRLLRHVVADDMATAVILTIDPATRVVRCASAGHPPPLMLPSPGAAVVPVAVDSGPPLGTAPSAEVAEVSLQCATGATIVLYTDGLVEERGHSIDAGIGRVAAAIAAHGADDAGKLADAVLRDVGTRGDLDDDVALLVVRFTEPGGETRSGAVAGDVSVVRAGP
jgi:serine phosphatase RsbU (regulator of sigma subunit)